MKGLARGRRNRALADIQRRAERKSIFTRKQKEGAVLLLRGITTNLVWKHEAIVAPLEKTKLTKGGAGSAHGERRASKGLRVKKIESP